jgi:hypothetical protein
MELWVLLHVATAFWFVAGLAGRDLTLARARASGEIAIVRSLADLAGVFDRYLVIPGSTAVLVLGLATAISQGRSFTGDGDRWMLGALVLLLSLLPLVPLVFIPKGKVFDAALEEAETEGHVTPALRAAFTDRAVGAARLYERIVVAVIIVLMVTEPF